MILVSHLKNRGYGSALKTGIKTAIKESFDYVLFMDSDLTNDPKDIPLLVAKMVQGYDVIKASRYGKRGAVRGVPIRRLVPSMIGNKIARFFYRLPISDCTNGFRAVRTDILSQMRLNENGFALIMEELYQSTFLAKSFCEVPYVLTSRKGGQAESKFSHRPQVFYKYLKYSVKAFSRRPPSSGIDFRG
jgi:glycosyltransferase involved in cell wall biosynthesis